jgi:hypothetical protein
MSRQLHIHSCWLKGKAELQFIPVILNNQHLVPLRHRPHHLGMDSNTILFG